MSEQLWCCFGNIQALFRTFGATNALGSAHVSAEAPNVIYTFRSFKCG